MPDQTVVLTTDDANTIRREIAELIAALERIDTRLKHAERKADADTNN